jgi:hypothetical protein
MIVYKYPVIMDPKTGVATCAMPTFAKILNIGLQGDNQDLFFWALTDPNQTVKSDRHFLIVPTGKEFDSIKYSSYIGTFRPGSLVFHVFECPPHREYLYREPCEQP